MKHLIYLMTNEIDIIQKALLEYRNALIIKELNQDLYNQLAGSIYYLLKYSEKYNVQLPNKDEILRMLEKTNLMIEEMRKSNLKNEDFSKYFQPKGNKEKTNSQVYSLSTEKKQVEESTEDETEPNITMIKYSWSQKRTSQGRFPSGPYPCSIES